MRLPIWLYSSLSLSLSLHIYKINLKVIFQNRSVDVRVHVCVFLAIMSVNVCAHIFPQTTHVYTHTHTHACAHTHFLELKKWSSRKHVLRGDMLRPNLPDLFWTQEELWKQSQVAGETPTQQRTHCMWISVTAQGQGFSKRLYAAFSILVSHSRRQSEDTGCWYFKALVLCLVYKTVAQEVRLSLFPIYPFSFPSCNVLLQKRSSSATHAT